MVYVDYTELRRSNRTKIIGVWDDNDYGVNDGGKDSPIKVDQKQIFLDYLDEPPTSPRRLRGDEIGIYEDYLLKLSPQISIRIILFDVRYNKVVEDN